MYSTHRESEYSREYRLLSRHRHQNAIHVRSKSDKRLCSKEVTRDAKRENKGIYNPQPPCLFIRPSTIGFPRHSYPLRTLRFRWPARAGARRHRRRPVRARSHSSPRVTGPRTSFNSQRRRNSSESNSSSSFCPPTYRDSRLSLTHTSWLRITVIHRLPHRTHNCRIVRWQ